MPIYQFKQDQVNDIFTTCWAYYMNIKLMFNTFCHDTQFLGNCGINARHALFHFAVFFHLTFLSKPLTWSAFVDCFYMQRRWWGSSQIKCCKIYSPACYKMGFVYITKGFSLNNSEVKGMSAIQCKANIFFGWLIKSTSIGN